MCQNSMILFRQDILAKSIITINLQFCAINVVFFVCSIVEVELSNGLFKTMSATIYLWMVTFTLFAHFKCFIPWNGSRNLNFGVSYIFEMKHITFLWYILIYCLLGHDTTTSAITWILYDLAKNPQYMKQCQEEIDTVLKNNPEFVSW